MEDHKQPEAGKDARYKLYKKYTSANVSETVRDSDIVRTNNN